MHIALVCRWYPPHSGFGGVATHNHYLAPSLLEWGHRVTAIAARWSRDVPSFEECEAVIVHRLLSQHHPRLHRLPGLGRHARAFVQWQYSRRVAKLLGILERSDPPDVIKFADVD